MSLKDYNVKNDWFVLDDKNYSGTDFAFRRNNPK
jgi:hypothetical protein